MAVVGLLHGRATTAAAAADRERRGAHTAVVCFGGLLQRAYPVRLAAGRLSFNCQKVQSLCFKKRQQQSGEAGAKTCSITRGWATLEVGCGLFEQATCG